MRLNGRNSNPRIVVVGGGTGISTLLTGLRDHTSCLTAIVTMFDNGGSSGILRYEFGYPPFGDLRRCLLALSDGGGQTESLRRLFEFRFGPKSSLNGHSLGNLVMAGVASMCQGTEEAISEVSRLLNVQGQVVPVTCDSAELCAELEDGRIIRGESMIDLRREGSPRIARIFLDPPVPASPKALEALLQADAIVLGPGDLYTSILPNILVEGVSQALADTSAIKMFVTNIMTKLGETDGFQASDFVRQVSQYIAPARLDWVLVNSTPVPEEIQATYRQEGAEPVEPDVNVVRHSVPGVLADALANDQLPLRHHPDRTAAAVLDIVRRTRAAGAEPALSASSQRYPMPSPEAQSLTAGPR